MKKLLLIALLTIAMICTLVACTEDVTPSTDTTAGAGTTVADETPTDPADTDGEDTTVADDGEETTVAGGEEETTVAGGEEETTVAGGEEETNPPAETLPENPGVGQAAQAITAMSWDTIFKNDENTFAQEDGGAAAKFTANPFKLDDTWTAILLRGWAGSGNADNKFVKFAYRIDLGEIVVDDNAYRTAEQPVLDAGGDARFCISIPTEALAGGFHYLRVYAICADDTAVEIINMWIEGRDLSAEEAAQPWDADKAVVTHLSFDELRKNDGTDGFFAPGALAQDPAAWDNIAKIDDTITSIKFWGWIGIVTDTVGQFGYDIDGGAPVYDDSFVFDTEQGVLDAAAGTGAATASRMLINIDLSGLSFGEHTVRVYYKGSDGAVALLREFTVLKVDPNAIPDWNGFGDTGDHHVNPEASHDLMIYVENGQILVDGAAANDNGAGGFTPFWQFNKSTIEATTANTELGIYTWLAVNGEYGAFGYQIDGGAPVWSESFATAETSGPVYDGGCYVAAAYFGIAPTNVSTFWINYGADLTGLAAGAHTVKFVYKNAAGDAVAFLEFTVNLTEAAVPAEPIVAENTAYALKGVNADGDLYFDGTVSSGRINATTDAAKVAPVYFEYTDVVNECYIYFMDGETKNYLAANGSGTKAFGFVTEKDDTCIWILDGEKKVIASKALENRAIGTQLSSTYTNFSTYSLSNYGVETQQGWYDWVWISEVPEIPPQMWDIAKDVVLHQSFDALNVNGGMSYFTEGQSASWNMIADLDADAVLLQYWGWIALADATVGQFGYAVNGGEIVYDDAWTVEAEQGVLDAAATTGAATASRMRIAIDIENLIGENTVTVYYKNAAGKVVILNTFTVIKPEPITINLGDNAIEVPAGGQVVIDFYAKNTGTYTFAWAEGETNGYIAFEKGNVSENLWASDTSFSIDLAKGEYLKVIVMTDDYAADTVNFVVTAAEPTPPAAPKAELGNNSVDVQNQVNLEFTAPKDATYVITWADGETNGFIAIEQGNVSENFWASDASFEIALSAGDVITLVVMTDDYSADTIDFVIAEKVAAPEKILYVLNQGSLTVNGNAIAAGTNADPITVAVGDKIELPSGQWAIVSKDAKEIGIQIDDGAIQFIAGSLGSYRSDLDQFLGWSGLEDTSGIHGVWAAFSYDLSGLAAGTYTINIVCSNTADQVATYATFTLVVTEGYVEPSEPTPVPGKDAGLVRFNADNATADNYGASITGWMGFAEVIDVVGASVDGGAIDWTAGANYNRAPEQAVKDLAGANAIRFSASISFPADMPYGEHKVTFYAKLANGVVAIIYEATVTTKDPGAVGSSEKNFDSTTTADLSKAFTFKAGLQPENCTYKTGSYKMSGINQLTTEMDGTYEFTVTNLKSNATGACLVFRGKPTPDFGDGSYYGHDGPSAWTVGCAGIYATIINGELKVNVRGNDNGKAVNHIYSIAMTGNVLKVVDDNESVKFYDGDTLLITVALSGNNAGYATEAVVTLANGTTETLTDVCAAFSAISDIGFIARSVDMTFDAVTLKGI